MPAVTRVDDNGIGYCSCDDSVVFVTFEIGCTTVIVNNEQAGAVDILYGRADCGHLTLAKQGSENVFFEYEPVHRIDDSGDILPGCGTYYVITGSDNVFANEGGDPVDISSISLPSVTPLVTITSSIGRSVRQSSKYPGSTNTPGNAELGITDIGPEVEDSLGEIKPTDPGIDCSSAVGTPNERVTSVLETILGESGYNISGGEVVPWTSGPYAGKLRSNSNMWTETGDNQNILETFKQIGIKSSTDSLAWCAAFVGFVLKKACCKYLPTALAGAYVNYGNPTGSLQRGDIVVFDRAGGSGHVAFYWGPGTRPDTIQVVGGNQSDSVTLVNSSVARIKSNGKQRPISA